MTEVGTGADLSRVIPIEYAPRFMAAQPGDVMLFQIYDDPPQVIDGDTVRRHEYVAVVQSVE